ncbi:hypothetical protein BGZ76_006903 [Entomortierella beljakovae]|nr:hypothetical protein BGZ76_006903 [Entomortierella beljakovae]
MSTTAAPVIVPCKYKTGRVLGEGTYAVVKGTIETGKRYAVKVVSKKLMEGRDHMIRNEIAVLKRISVGHSNILTLVDYFETVNNLYLVTDLAEGGELFDRLYNKGNYYERDAVNLVRTVCEGVVYLHEQGIVHRDLKPENLLFRTATDDSGLLIADFGLSKIIDHEKFRLLTTTCGTPGYMAPEIFQKSGHGKPVDMWAIGVITYFLLCGYTPFDRQNSVEEMEAILHAEYKFEPVEYWRGVSESAKSFVTRLLTVDPNQRMTAQEALEHPWLSQEPQVDTAHGGNNASSESRQKVQEQEGSTDMEGVEQHDLLPNMMARIKAKSNFRNAIQAVKAINKMKKLRDELGSEVHPEEVSHVLQHDDDDVEMA